MYTLFLYNRSCYINFYHYIGHSTYITIIMYLNNNILRILFVSYRAIIIYEDLHCSTVIQ